MKSVIAVILCLVIPTALIAVRTAFRSPSQSLRKKRTNVWLSLSVVCPLFLLGMALLAIPAQAQTRAYVPNQVSNSVSVIDTSSNTVVATVVVGNYPDQVAITPDGTRAYVTNISLASVSVIDTSSNTVVATVGVGAAPEGVAITPDGARAYVTDSGQFPSPGVLVNSVSVIDTNPSDASYNTVVATVGVGAAPGGVTITPDGTRAYVLNYGSNSVSVIDTSSNTVVATVGVGIYPVGGVAITPDGTRAYVSNRGSNYVSVIDTSGNTVVATVVVGDLPYGVAITPDGTRAYVTNAYSNSVSVIDTNPSDASYNTVVATVGVGDFPGAVAITPASPYAAQIQQPINSDGSSVFSVKRGVVPVKFTLTLRGNTTCQLPTANISLTRTAGTSVGSVDESTYLLASDSGSNFRTSSCQYVYNLGTGSLGTGTYAVNISIRGSVVGSGTFGLQ